MEDLPLYLRLFMLLGMSGFVDHLHEVFRHFGAVQSRKMFGGYGLYHQGLMFGLIADDELFLKVDKENKHHFEEKELGPFIYQKNGKDMAMSYHRAPEEIFDDPELAVYWANLAYEAALRKPVSKKKTSKITNKSGKGKST